MQLDFGFPRLQPTPGVATRRVARSRAEALREQFELYGIDRLQQHTVFFAALPDASVKAAVGQMMQDASGRHEFTGNRMDPSRLHISLVLLCKQNPQPLALEAEEAVTQAARFVRMEPFDVTMSRLVTVGRKSDETNAAQLPIVLMTAEADGLKGLNQRLHQVLERGRLVGKVRRFVPHMTVAYDTAVKLDEPVPPIKWTVREFHLIHSLHGKSQYRVLATFPLRG